MQQASSTEASAENTEDQTITIDFSADDDMIPPSAKMVKESQNASEEG